MKLIEIAQVPTLEYVTQIARDSFKSSRMCPRWAQVDQPQLTGNGMSFGIRDWGQWEMPEGEEDDGDYDFKVPTQETDQAAFKIIQGLRQQFPMFDFHYGSGEKNWIDIQIYPKKQ